jgi:hypothetical protein
MDRMLDCFVKWATAVRQHLESFRYWCDAVDPLSGIPLFGAPGDETWNEVQAAQELLGYATSDHGVCPVVLHPVHGTPISLQWDRHLPIEFNHMCLSYQWKLMLVFATDWQVELIWLFLVFTY